MTDHFDATAHIGQAIHTLAEAELTVAAVDELPPATRSRLDQVLATVFDDLQ